MRFWDVDEQTLHITEYSSRRVESKPLYKGMKLPNLEKHHWPYSPKPCAIRAGVCGYMFQEIRSTFVI